MGMAEQRNNCRNCAVVGLTTVEVALLVVVVFGVASACAIINEDDIRHGSRLRFIIKDALGEMVVAARILFNDMLKFRIANEKKVVKHKVLYESSITVYSTSCIFNLYIFLTVPPAAASACVDRVSRPLRHFGRSRHQHFCFT